MQFRLNPQNFQLEQPFYSQIMDQSAKAEEIFNYLAQCFGNNDLQIYYQQPDLKQGLINPNDDLKPFYDTKAQLFLIQPQQDQLRPQDVHQVADQTKPQNMFISVYQAEGDQNKLIVQENVDPNLSLGQYLIQIIQKYNIPANSLQLFDHESKYLTDYQNLKIENFKNYPFLSMILFNSQIASQQGILIYVFKLEGDQNKLIVQENVDPNLSLGQYLIQIIQKYNIPANSLQLFDHESKLLTDNQNLKIENFKNYPFLSMILLNSQIASQQGILIYVFKLEGDQNKLIVQENVDPNLSLGQYLIQIIQKYNIPANSLQLFDHESKLLTDNQNLKIENFKNYPFLSMILFNNQQLQPIQNNNLVYDQNHQQQLSQQHQTPEQQQIPINYGLQIIDQQLLNNNNFSNQQQLQNNSNPNYNNKKPSQDSHGQVDVNVADQFGKFTLEPQQKQYSQGIPIDEQISQTKNSIVILKQISLYFDPSGEYITYKYHYPIQLNGSIRKSQSTSTNKSTNSQYKWISVHQNKYEYVQLDEYSFRIKWEGGNESELKVKLQ
ncbi:unnamed protein product [Paramecium sonneborni]|uniref:Uncharacterized protein n=1 Tax=Paramecium sonneborni TaxID=65129 RepID=A0A8S1L1V7_9CILI|nr:unnamed protein product [Paramecium sonneborni]